MPWVSLQMIMEIAKSPLLFKQVGYYKRTVLPTDSNIIYNIKLDARKMAVSIVIYTLSVNYSIIKILLSYFPNK